MSNPDDSAEKEAERVAEEVMGMSAERQGSGSPNGAEPPGDGDSGDSSTPPAVDPIVDRAPRIEQSPRSGGTAGNQQAGEDVERALGSSSGGRRLSLATRSFFEPRFGRDFGDVRVHTDSEAADLNRQLDAKAFTHGSDVYFGEGQYRPGSADGKQLMAHELTHVVQQTGDGSDIGRAPVETIQQQPKAQPSIGDLRKRRLEDLFNIWVEHDYQHMSVPPPAAAREEIKHVIRRKLDTKDRQTLQWFLDNEPNVNHANGYWLREAIRYQLREKGSEDTGEEKESTSGDEEKLPGADTLQSPKFRAGDAVQTDSNLRLHEGPGLGYQVNVTIPEGTAARVVRGPKEAMSDAYVWWKIEFTSGHSGWAAQSELTPWMTAVRGESATGNIQEDATHLKQLGKRFQSELNREQRIALARRELFPQPLLGVAKDNGLSSRSRVASIYNAVVMGEYGRALQITEKSTDYLSSGYDEIFATIRKFLTETRGRDLVERARKIQEEKESDFEAKEIKNKEKLVDKLTAGWQQSVSEEQHITKEKFRNKTEENLKGVFGMNADPPDVAAEKIFEMMNFDSRDDPNWQGIIDYVAQQVDQYDKLLTWTEIFLHQLATWGVRGARAAATGVSMSLASAILGPLSIGALGYEMFKQIDKAHQAAARRYQKVSFVEEYATSLTTKVYGNRSSPHSWEDEAMEAYTHAKMRWDEETGDKVGKAVKKAHEAAVSHWNQQEETERERLAKQLKENYSRMDLKREIKQELWPHFDLVEEGKEERRKGTLKY